VDIYPTEDFMINEMLIGDSTIKVWNVQFIGAHDARGVFYNKDTPLEISEGIILSTGNAISAQGPNKGSGYSTSHATKGDKDLHFLAQFRTLDATYISFEFIPTQDLIRFNYVFASDEYPEYVGSPFNDVFGFFLTDLKTGEVTNLAVIPNTDLPITVNNINHLKYANFYIKNKTGREAKDALLEYDGLTKPLIAYSKVVPGRKYRIKIAIADVADDAYDSSVFLEGKSFRSEKQETFFTMNSLYFDAFADDDINPQLTSTPETILTNSFPTTSNPGKSPPITSHKDEIIPHLDSLIVYFDFDKSAATSTELNRLSSELKNIPISSYTIQVIGHTDQRGTQGYNQILSEKRAEFMALWLTNKYSVTIREKEGKSFTQLAQTQTSDEARSKNRRVIIFFSVKKQNHR
jgi:outer membrane protein OmpA-like peptidoglycan-associated protein